MILPTTFSLFATDPVLSNFFTPGVSTRPIENIFRFISPGSENSYGLPAVVKDLPFTISLDCNLLKSLMVDNGGYGD